jgi:hypothetical protein
MSDDLDPWLQDALDDTDALTLRLIINESPDPEERAQAERALAEIHKRRANRHKEP